MKILDQLFSSNIFGNNQANKQTTRTDSLISNNLFSNISDSDVQGMDKVESLLKDLKHPVSNSEASSIESFMKNSSGSVESKLDTIEWAVEKDIPLTEKNLSAIQETLNGQMNENDTVETLMGMKDNAESSIEVSTEEIIERIQSSDSIPDSVKQALGKALASGSTSEEALLKAVQVALGQNVEIKGNAVFIESASGSEQTAVIELADFLSAIESALSAIENGSDKSFESLLKDVLKGVLDSEGLSSLADSLFEEADQVSKQDNGGLEEAQSKMEPKTEETEADEDEAFRKEMLKRLEASIDEVMDALIEELTDDSSTEALSAADDIRFKTFLVTKVTEQAIAAKETFQTVKKEIVQSIRDIGTVQMEQDKVDVSETLSKAIDKLDNMMMKSDVTLFTNMTMERNLLNMSSSLQDARKLLGKGDVEGALKIAKSVGEKLDAMIFKPAEKNIQLMAFRNGENLLEVTSKTMPTLNTQETSARGVLELFRNMGLNHEPEVAEKLLSSNSTDKAFKNAEDYKIKDNLKAVLLKLMETEEPDQKRSVAASEKTYNNLTGQQLMNKLETKQDTQTLFFHVPVETAGEVNDLKLYVNSRKNGDSIDWENNSLYFSIDLKNFGETGILVQTNDRTLNISVKNDYEGFEDVMKPLVSALQKDFVNVGYKLGTVTFSNLEGSASAKEMVSANKAQTTRRTSGSVKVNADDEKGFDLSI